MLATVTRRFRFEAAHNNPYHNGACHRLHGHSYTLAVSVRGPVKPLIEGDPESGMVMDLSNLAAIVRENVIVRCDHQYLNDLGERFPNLYNPTIEFLIHWMWYEIAPHLPAGVKLAALTLHETAANSVTITHPDLGSPQEGG